MSDRHKPGNIVRKRPGAGFLGMAGLRWQIQGDPEAAPESEINGMAWCPMQCGDDDCFEWHDLWEIDADGKPTGAVACHVCDCELTPEA